MKKILLPLFGFLVLVLAACAKPATQIPLATDTATATLVQPTETLQPTPTETQIPATATESATETPASTPTEAPITGISFTNEIMPILKNSCNKCHGIEQVKEGLDMTSYESLMSGSFNGSVITAGDASKSFLVQQLLDGEMPKRGPKLTAEQIQHISDWINAGALNN